MNNDDEEQEAVDVEVVEEFLVNNDDELSENDKELERYF